MRRICRGRPILRREMGDEEAPPSARHQPKRVLEHGSFVTASKRAKPDQPGRELPALSCWVSCDNCEKWRRVAQEPTLEKWCCSDNLDSKHNACNVPQEMSNVAIDRELGLALAAPSHRRGHCEHGQRRSSCKECGGASICQHAPETVLCFEHGGDAHKSWMVHTHAHLNLRGQLGDRERFLHHFERMQSLVVLAGGAEHSGEST